MRGRGGFSSRGGGGRGGFRGGRGGGGGSQNWNEPPSQLISVGVVMHPCEEFIVLSNRVEERVPIFNRPLYLENKTKIGVIDDVFGPISDFMFSVKCDTGVKPSSFKEGQTIYMNPEHFLPMHRFLPKPKGESSGSKGGSRGGRGGARGGFSGGRGTFSGGRGVPRGGTGGFRGGSGGFRGNTGSYNRGSGGFRGRGQ